MGSPGGILDLETEYAVAVRWAKRLTVAAAVGCFWGALAGTPAALAEGDFATDKDYEVTVLSVPDKDPHSGVLTLSIVAKHQFELHDNTPISAELVSGAGLTLQAAKLGRAELVQSSAKTNVWRTHYKQAAAKGEQNVTADFVFFLCSDKICQRLTAHRTVTVN